MPANAQPTGIARLLRSIKDSLFGKAQDYTSGNLHVCILMLAVPMMLEMAMESVFVVVDMYFLGFLGAPAIAAVGLTESVLTLLYALSIGLAMGTTAMVARRVGEGDVDAARRVTLQAIYIGVGISVVIGLIGVLYAEEILSLMEADASVIEAGSGYTRLLIGSNVVIMLLFLINAAFRGAGDPSLAMRSLWLANAINIVLDPCLIHGYGPFPAMGATGAALATTIGRGSGVLYQFWMLFSPRAKGHLRLRGMPMSIDFGVIKRLLRVSMGGILQMLIATASWVFLMRIVSEFGKVPVAGYTIAVRILVFTFLPAWGLSNAAATLVGQNLGAQQPDRAEKAVWLTGLYNMAFLALVTVVFLTLAPVLVHIFTDDPEIARYGIDSLRIISYGYVFYAWALVMMQAFNGAGDTMTPTWLNLFCFWCVQIPGAWYLALGADLGPSGVFWSVMGAESLLAVLSMLVFRRGKWKTRDV